MASMKVQKHFLITLLKNKKEVKMKILYLPLDERPCNADYPLMLENKDLQILTISKNILGKKKQPGNTNQIAQSLLQLCKQCDTAVLSIDMLLYGGLLPSRLHHESKDILVKRLDTLAKMKEINPALKIYAFQCIMRCPQYNSSEEEPDYYDTYGFSLFREEYLKDKKKRGILSREEETELYTIQIPETIKNDYKKRREINIALNTETLTYVENGTIDFYVIPQDDSSPFGYTAEDQKKVLSQISKKHLELQTMVYPGADEVGQSLIARAYNNFFHRKPKIYPYYASVLGPQIIPKYEDRPMYESLKSHIRVTGALIARNPEEADYILAINSPGKIMQESFDKEKDISYSSYRELLNFVEMIKEDCDKERKVLIADCAYANGGDLQLLKYLDAYSLLDKIYAYAGWNTHCNTLGTVLAVGQTTQGIPSKTIIYRILEDCFYQADIRLKVVEKDLEELHLSYYNFKDSEPEVAERIEKYLLQEYQRLTLSKKYPIESLQVTMPWHRMFEIGMKIHYKNL